MSSLITLLIYWSNSAFRSSGVAWRQFLPMALLLRKIPLEEASIRNIAQGLMQQWFLDLPLDEPTIAARRYLGLGAPEVQTAFTNWLRPDDLARVSQRPIPK